VVFERAYKGNILIEDKQSYVIEPWDNKKGPQM
jgi:hypothetical protein